MDIGLIVNCGTIIIWIVGGILWFLKQLKTGGVDMAINLHPIWKSFQNNKIVWILVFLTFLSQLFTLYLFVAKPSWQIINFSPKIYPPFESVYHEHQDQLGKSRSNPIKDANPYIAAHEHATVIYLGSEPAFYRLEPKTSSWTIYREPIWEITPKWFNDKILRKYFHTPEGLYPPYGSVAKCWDRDKSSWNWIGWRIWHCNLTNIYFQRFEHGIIMGNFPKVTNYKKDFTVFILTYDDHKWESFQAIGGDIPDCTAPKDLQ
jgi:hypothetical protein